MKECPYCKCKGLYYIEATQHYVCMRCRYDAPLLEFKEEQMAVRPGFSELPNFNKAYCRICRSELASNGVCLKLDCNSGLPTIQPGTVVAYSSNPSVPIGCVPYISNDDRKQAQEAVAASRTSFAPPYNGPVPTLDEIMMKREQKDREVVEQGGTQFSTGAVRSADKAGVMYHLITPIGMRRIAETYKEGFDKYGAFNWERGMPIGDILNHAIAHIYAYLSDEKTGEDDLAHAAWNLLAAMHMEETHPELDHQLRPNHPLVIRASAEQYLREANEKQSIPTPNNQATT